jgi:DNA-binding NarL/FixJ family response regulator
MSAGAVRLAVVEDQPLYRQMLVSLLDSVSSLTVVASAGSATEAGERLARTAVDVAILDIELGDGDGISLGRVLRQRDPHLGVVLLSATDSMNRLLQIAPAELHGWSYLSKTSALTAQSLVATVHAAASGRSVLDRALIAGRALRRGSPLERLSSRQQDVLGLLAAGLSNAAIAAQLGIAVRSVDNHVTAIYAALELKADGESNPRVLATLRFLEGSR